MISASNREKSSTTRTYLHFLYYYPHSGERSWTTTSASDRRRGPEAQPRRFPRWHWHLSRGRSCSQPLTPGRRQSATGGKKMHGSTSILPRRFPERRRRRIRPLRSRPSSSNPALDSAQTWRVNSNSNAWQPSAGSACSRSSLRFGWSAAARPASK